MHDRGDFVASCQGREAVEAQIKGQFPEREVVSSAANSRTKHLM